MANNTAVAIVRAHDEGEQRWFYGGGVHTWKATAAETGGAFVLFEDVMERGKATPLHRHADVDEALYVLEGEIVVVADGHAHTVGTGGFCFAPRGLAHAFLVTSERARLLCLQAPGSAEAFYRDASEPLAGGAGPAGRVDFARIAVVAEQTGATEILGPPPFDMA
jgi:quercetin dioxygenase-like cupin family protein